MMRKPTCDRCGNKNLELVDSLGIWWKCYVCNPYGHSVEADSATAAHFGAGRESAANLDHFKRTGQLP